MYLSLLVILIMISLNKITSLALRKNQISRNRISLSNRLFNPKHLSNIHSSAVLNKESNIATDKVKNSQKVTSTTSKAFQTSDDIAPVSYDSLSIKDKFKYMWKKYGVVAIGTYFGLYVTTLGSIFLSLDYDLFNSASFGLDPNTAIKKVCDLFLIVTGSSSLPDFIHNNPKVGTFAIAWVMTKFTEPIRLGLTLAVLPTVAKLLGREPIVQNNESHDKKSI
mmetsp:Transcript_3823/g.3432  ORF Transcript_3823/g.3432 Transcript_3823/m.3432 type:complete len:222 (-) Transcript_3823:64-729(-)